MVRLGALLRRSPREKSEPKPVIEPARVQRDGPSIVVMIPDVAGVSSFRINRFPDAQGAVRFLTSLTRQQRERAHAFWALQHEPSDTLEGEDASGEAMVLIRSAEGSDLVYIVSFLDIESAQSFARFEVKRGMHLGLILVYWASMVNVVLDEDGVQLIPEFPPRIGKRRQRAATSTVQAPRLPSLAKAPETKEVSPAEQVSNGLGKAPSETEEQARPEAEAEEQRRRLEAEAAEAEERRRLEAEAAEQRRLEAEGAEKQRLEAEAAQRRLEAEAEGQRHLEAEAEQRRLEAAAQQRRLEAEAEEQRRLEAEAEQARLQAEAEERRLEAEAEQRRLEADAERRRLEAEAEEQRRLEAEAEEQRRLEVEAEQRRLEAEEEAHRLQAEADQQRLEAEAEKQRRLEAEAEQRRLEAEAEEQRQLAAEAERRRMEAEAAEQRRLEAEAALARVAAEAEAEELRMAAEIEEQQRIEAEEQRRLEAEAEDQRLFEAQKRAIFAAAQREQELAAASGSPEVLSDQDNSIAQSLREPANPIEELLRQDAKARVDIPSEYAPKPRNETSEETEADGDEEPERVADDLNKILRKRRWEKRDSPFEGFKSPPGRF